MTAVRHAFVPLAAATALALGIAIPAHAGKTLDAVKARGEVICGVNTSAPGFSSTDSKGRWQGLDVDTCRAVAAAVLGSGDKVKFVPLNSQQRFTALQSGEIDILSRNSTWTLTRDASLGIVFTGINYYDGQGFMVPRKLKVDSAKKLNGATVCVQAGTTSEKNVADFFLANGMKYKSVVFDTAEAIQSAFFAGRCQVYTTDMSDLAGARTQTAKPDDYAILPEVISKEPLGPAVRRGDDDWFQIVRWSLFALIEARGHRQAARPRQGVGVPDRQAGRHLRRELRAQHGAEVAARPAAGREQAVEPGRPHVRAAGALTGPRRFLDCRAQDPGATPGLPALAHRADSHYRCPGAPVAQRRIS